jgi:hypothetical protein
MVSYSISMHNIAEASKLFTCNLNWTLAVALLQSWAGDGKRRPYGALRSFHMFSIGQRMAQASSSLLR